MLANVGDSKAALLRDGELVALTKEHLAKDEEEK
jgi:serine/threonine protein phosphatase PrpC